MWVYVETTPLTACSRLDAEIRLVQNTRFCLVDRRNIFILLLMTKENIRGASRQFVSLPIVQTFLPVTFAYSLSSEGVVMRQLRRWRRLWRRSLTHSHKRTSKRSCRSFWNGTTSELQPEEITSKGTRVSCVYSQ